MLQFDPTLDPAVIGTSDKWLWATGLRGSKPRLERYLQSLAV
jgi:hypothetical protein